MNPYINKLKAYLSEHQPKYGCPEIPSLLEFLWQTYTSENPIKSAEIRALMESLTPIHEALSIEDSDMLFGTVCSLCTEYERLAFLEGLRTGARLTTELALV